MVAVPTATAAIVNFPVVLPAATVIIEGSMSRSPVGVPLSATTVPPCGAAELNVIMPLTGVLNPTVADVRARAIAGVATLTAILAGAKPSAVADIFAVPPLPDVTVNVTDVAPAGTVTLCGTAAIFALLLTIFTT